MEAIYKRLVQVERAIERTATIEAPGREPIFTSLTVQATARPTVTIEQSGVTAKARLFSPAGGGQRLDITTNLSFDGSSWQRDDTSLGGMQLRLDTRSGQNLVEIQYAASGANPATFASLVRWTSDGNMGLGTGSFGTSAAKVLAIGNGTAPTTSPTDVSQLWSADAAGTAGRAWPHFRPETGTNRAIVGVSGRTTALSTGTGTTKMAGATSRDNTGWLTVNDEAGNTVYVPYWTTITG